MEDIRSKKALRVALGVLTAEYGESMRGHRIAVSVPGIADAHSQRLLSLTIPQDVSGIYRIVAGLVPAGMSPNVHCRTSSPYAVPLNGIGPTTRFPLL